MDGVEWKVTRTSVTEDLNFDKSLVTGKKLHHQDQDRKKALEGDQYEQLQGTCLRSLLCSHHTLPFKVMVKKIGGRWNSKDQTTLHQAPAKLPKKQQDGQQRASAGEDTTTTFTSAHRL